MVNHSYIWNTSLCISYYRTILLQLNSFPLIIFWVFLPYMIVLTCTSWPTICGIWNHISAIEHNEIFTVVPNPHTSPIHIKTDALSWQDSWRNHIITCKSHWSSPVIHLIHIVELKQKQHDCYQEYKVIWFFLSLCTLAAKKYQIAQKRLFSITILLNGCMVLITLIGLN